MKRLIGRPSPAMVVALLALFVALGGSGYAAVKINGKKLKNSSVSGRKLKNRTINRKKIKKNTLTGTEINELKLGKVPAAALADNANHANAADNATHANSANTATFAGAVSGVMNFGLKRATAAASQAAAPKIPLGSRGAFSFYAKCYIAASKVQAAEYIALSSGEATFDTEDQGRVPDPLATPTARNFYLTSSTAEANRVVEQTSHGAAANSVDVDDEDGDFRATDGKTTLTGVVGLAAAKQGTPTFGNGPFGSGDKCLFGGIVFG